MGFGRRTIDFVGQQELREDGAWTKTEFLLLHVEDRRPGDVRGHQVSGELNPPALASQHAAHRAHEQRLAQAGYALDQHVPAGKERHQRAQHELVLADVDFGDFSGDAFEQRLDSRHARARGGARRGPAIEGRRQRWNVRRDV